MEEKLLEYIDKLEDTLLRLSEEFFTMDDSGNFMSENITHHQILAKMVNDTLDSHPNLQKGFE